jgi:hypothetical protein
MLRKTYCLHLQGLLVILFNPDDGGRMFLHENYRRVQIGWIQKNQSNKQSVRSYAVMAVCEILNCHGSDYKEKYLLGCDAM